jgi:hypothetical protein
MAHIEVGFAVCATAAAAIRSVAAMMRKLFMTLFYHIPWRNGNVDMRPGDFVEYAPNGEAHEA